MGGGGALPEPGTGGGARGGGTSGADFADAVEIVDDGREAGLGGGFLRFATSGFTGAGGGEPAETGRGGGRTPGGFGAEATGGLELSFSDLYGESRLAPVSTPPRLRSLGIPPARIPASCGGAPGALSPPAPAPAPLSLRPRLAAPGIGGACAVGGFFIPGTGGALATGGAPPDFTPPETWGADLSLVTAFFNRVPLLISDRSAPYPKD